MRIAECGIPLVTCVLVTLCLGLALPVCADDPGSSSGQFLMLGPGARPAAMGNAYTAIADGVNAMYWNPAGLARLQQSEVMFMHSRWFQDIDYNYLAYVHGDPVWYGQLGANVTFLDYGNIDITRISNQTPITGLGQTDASDLAMSLGYGQEWYMVDWGVNMKYIREKIAGKDDYAVAFDLGLLCNNLPYRNLSLGATVMNIGTKLNLQSRSYELPLTLKIGGAYQFEQLPLLLTADCIIPRDDRVQAAIGGEWRIFDIMALRIGYNSENDAGNGVTAGAGFYLGDEFNIDYAYVPYGDIGDAHRISLAYKFGPRIEQQRDPYRQPNYQPQYQPRYQPQYSQPTVEYQRPQSTTEQTPPAYAPPANNARTREEYIADGVRYYSRGDYRRSIAEYREALERYPQDAIINYNLAVSYYALGDYPAAQTYFQQATAINPNDADAYLYLGICYQQQGDINRARVAWQRAYEMDPGNPAVRQLLGQY